MNIKEFINEKYLKILEDTKKLDVVSVVDRNGDHVYLSSSTGLLDQTDGRLDLEQILKIELSSYHIEHSFLLDGTESQITTLVLQTKGARIFDLDKGYGLFGEDHWLFVPIDENDTWEKKYGGMLNHES